MVGVLATATSKPAAMRAAEIAWSNHARLTDIRNRVLRSLGFAGLPNAEPNGEKGSNDLARRHQLLQATRWRRLYAESSWENKVSRHLQPFRKGTEQNCLRALGEHPERYDPLYPNPAYLYLPSCFLAPSSSPIALIDESLVQKFHTAVRLIRTGHYIPGVKLFFDSYLRNGSSERTTMDYRSYEAITSTGKYDPRAIGVHPEFLEVLARSILPEAMFDIRPDNLEMASDLYACLTLPHSRLKIDIPEEIIDPNVDRATFPQKASPAYDPKSLLMNPYTADIILLLLARANHLSCHNKVKDIMVGNNPNCHMSRGYILSDLLLSGFLDSGRYTATLTNPVLNKGAIVGELWTRLQDIAYNTPLHIPMVDAFNEVLFALGSTPYSVIHTLCRHRSGRIDYVPEAVSPTISAQTLVIFEASSRDIALALFERILARPDFKPNSKSFELMISIVLKWNRGVMDLGDLTLACEIFRLLEGEGRSLFVPRTSKMYDMLINEALLHDEFDLAEKLYKKYLYDCNVVKMCDMSRAGIDLGRIINRFTDDKSLDNLPHNRHGWVPMNGLPI